MIDATNIRYLKSTGNVFPAGTCVEGIKFWCHGRIQVLSSKIEKQQEAAVVRHSSSLPNSQVLSLQYKPVIRPLVHSITLEIRLAFAPQHSSISHIGLRALPSR